MTYTASPLDAGRAIWTTLGQHGPNLRQTTSLGGSPASTAWPANNDAYLWPLLLSAPTTFSGAFFLSGTSPGTTTFDIGIYRDDFTLVTSLGSTAAVNTTAAVLPVGGGSFATPVTLSRGRYFFAMSSAATTLTVVAGLITGNSVFRLLPVFKMAAAHPLPATVTPASVGTGAFMACVGLTTPGAASSVL